MHHHHNHTKATLESLKHSISFYFTCFPLRYIQIRDYIVSSYRLRPTAPYTLASLRMEFPCDSCLSYRIFHFLVQQQLINAPFHTSDLSDQDEQLTNPESSTSPSSLKQPDSSATVDPLHAPPTFADALLTLSTAVSTLHEDELKSLVTDTASLLHIQSTSIHDVSSYYFPLLLLLLQFRISHSLNC